MIARRQRRLRTRRATALLVLLADVCPAGRLPGAAGAEPQRVSGRRKPRRRRRWRGRAIRLATRRRRMRSLARRNGWHGDAAVPADCRRGAGPPRAGRRYAEGRLPRRLPLTLGTPAQRCHRLHPRRDPRAPAGARTAVCSWLSGSGRGRSASGPMSAVACARRPTVSRRAAVPGWASAARPAAGRFPGSATGVWLDVDRRAAGRRSYDFRVYLRWPMGRCPRRDCCRIRLCDRHLLELRICPDPACTPRVPSRSAALYSPAGGAVHRSLDPLRP
jgi:hypothetical protein